jgi:hypothetical protein
MNVNRDIFRSVHERKWLSVEYRNAQGETTRYWMGVLGIDPKRRGETLSHEEFIALGMAAAVILAE